ncbi:hypothetical protein [Rhodococcus kronopolitis]|uniref:Uncharacterized protein n=1 Tax=Rhodococcus kronopolitis TaxID=1460226 RepID=A0ABV9FMF5_9NOCA
MQLEVDLDSDVAPVTLTGVDEFTRLAVTVSGGPDADRMASVLGGWGIVDGGHIWLEIAELERAVRAHPDRVTDWLPQFVSMIDYAESRGWVDGENRRVRAHCERVVRS